MADHIKIDVTVTGDLISAISKTLDIAKAIKQPVVLSVQTGITMRVDPSSYVQDLITIAMLEKQLKELQNNQKQS